MGSVGGTVGVVSGAVGSVSGFEDSGCVGTVSACVGGTGSVAGGVVGIVSASCGGSVCCGSSSSCGLVGSGLTVEGIVGFSTGSAVSVKLSLPDVASVSVEACFSSSSLSSNLSVSSVTYVEKVGWELI